MDPTIAAESECALCAGPAEGERNFGLDLCSVCARGELRGRIDAWGGVIEIQEVLLEDVSDKLEGLLRGGLRSDSLEESTALHVVATAERLPPLMATFTNKTLLARVRSIFKRSAFATGDPLFDAKIVTETRTPQLLQQLLHNDGFQSAILALVTHTGGFEVAANKLEVLAPLSELDVRAEIPLAAAAVLRHVARLR